MGYLYVIHAGDREREKEKRIDLPWIRTDDFLIYTHLPTPCAAVTDYTQCCLFCSLMVSICTSSLTTA